MFISTCSYKVLLECNYYILFSGENQELRMTQNVLDSIPTGGGGGPERG